MGRGTRTYFAIAVALSISTRFAAAASSEQAAFSIIYSFNGGPERLPQGGVVVDQNGKLYGTTAQGGRFGLGTVYKLTPPTSSGEAWAETVMHDFKGGLRDGSSPVSGLIIDQSGGLYGTTLGGGRSNSGTAFKLSPTPGQMDWTESVLHSFGASGDAANPGASFSLFADKNGALYGTTIYNDSSAPNCGAVFGLTPLPGGTSWKEVVLRSFVDDDRDGCGPSDAAVIGGQDGALYGTTTGGGNLNFGVAYKLARPTVGKKWQLTVLHTFGRGNDGAFPLGRLALDQSGALYGTTLGSNSGLESGAIAFKLTPPAPGQSAWTETVLHRFPIGVAPNGDLVVDRLGTFYGTTSGGGAFGPGVIFKLTPPAPGKTTWTESVLHDFTEAEGGPSWGLATDQNGFLYGTTVQSSLVGTIFLFRPYFPRTRIRSTSSTAKYAIAPTNVFAPAFTGQCTWYVYGRVMELASTSDLSSGLLTTMPRAFDSIAHAGERNANEWPDRLPGHWIATSKSSPLPINRRRIGLLAVYDGPPPNGHVGFVEEVSADKRQYRMSQFNRTGTEEYSDKWYYFDGADGQPDGSLGAKDQHITTRWYPSFFDPSDPSW